MTLRSSPQGTAWWFERWHPGLIAAGITSRQGTVQQLLAAMPSTPARVEAEQVHGASVAIVEQTESLAAPIAGCDALVTSRRGLALLIRTADCLPLFFVHPERRLVGLAHAGWRGLAAGLPARVVSAFRQAYRVLPEALHVAIGPAIRACCYEVGPEFESRFAGFVQRKQGRRMCDLIGVAVDQLKRSGVAPQHIADAGHCTHCEADRWYSLRREGQQAGRLTSAIMLRAA